MSRAPKSFSRMGFLSFFKYMCSYLGALNRSTHGERYIDLVWYELAEVLAWMDHYEPNLSDQVLAQTPTLNDYFVKRTSKYCQIEGKTSHAEMHDVRREFASTWRLFVSEVQPKDLFRDLGVVFLDWIGEVVGFQEVKDGQSAESSMRDAFTLQTKMVAKLIDINAEQLQLEQFHIKHTYAMMHFVRFMRTIEDPEIQKHVKLVLDDQAKLLGEIYEKVQYLKQLMQNLMGTLEKFQSRLRQMTVQDESLDNVQDHNQNQSQDESPVDNQEQTHHYSLVVQLPNDEGKSLDG